MWLHCAPLARNRPIPAAPQAAHSINSTERGAHAPGSSTNHHASHKCSPSAALQHRHAGYADQRQAIPNGGRGRGRADGSEHGEHGDCPAAARREDGALASLLTPCQRLAASVAPQQPVQQAEGPARARWENALAKARPSWHAPSPCPCHYGRRFRMPHSRRRPAGPSRSRTSVHINNTTL